MANLKMVETLEIGRAYARPDLSRLWGLAGYQAISRGVYTPSGEDLIFLFVTPIKQNCLTQYNDFIYGDLLFWEGKSGTVPTIASPQLQPRVSGSICSIWSVTICHSLTTGRSL